LYLDQYLEPDHESSPLAQPPAQRAVDDINTVAVALGDLQSLLSADQVRPGDDIFYILLFHFWNIFGNANIKPISQTFTSELQNFLPMSEKNNRHRVIEELKRIYGITDLSKLSTAIGLNKSALSSWQKGIGTGEKTGMKLKEKLQFMFSLN
jgi:hypothetical protein